MSGVERVNQILWKSTVCFPHRLHCSDFVHTNVRQLSATKHGKL